MRIFLLALAPLALGQNADRAFTDIIRPVLEKATNVADIEANRGLWRNVAAQMRNRTMEAIRRRSCS